MTCLLLILAAVIYAAWLAARRVHRAWRDTGHAIDQLIHSLPRKDPS